ncbi:hypothetical protein [Streptomyces sp. NPDC006510]|uniref:hypothetical protein n=1 Tax=Streptomyces sp. NPDC006510 TaxID=3155600 RepID=UPI0033A3F6A3
MPGDPDEKSPERDSPTIYTWARRGHEFQLQAKTYGFDTPNIQPRSFMKGRQPTYDPFVIRTVRTVGVRARRDSCRSADDTFQDLLGIPRLHAGATRVTLDLLIPWLYVRQRDLPNDYLGRQSKEQRIAVARVLLGADDEIVDPLRQEAAVRAKKWRSASNRVKKILRDREERELPSRKDLQLHSAQGTTQHEEASVGARRAGGANVVCRLNWPCSSRESHSVLIADDELQLAGMQVRFELAKSTHVSYLYLTQPDGRQRMERYKGEEIPEDAMRRFSVQIQSGPLRRST